MKNISIKIEELEILLQNPNSRKSKEFLNNVIDNDFKEIGKSGVEYNKKDILDSLPLEKERNFVIENFEIKILSKNLVLATYITVENNEKTLRSSIWKKDIDWKILFHQGTKTK